MRLNHHCLIGNGFYPAAAAGSSGRTKFEVLQLFDGERWVNANPG